MSIIQTKISRFFRNIFILIIEKIYKGGTILTNNMKTFLEYYEVDDTNSVVKKCEKLANCDSLCNSTIKFGDFSNELIMGDTAIFDRFSNFSLELDKLANRTSANEETLTNLKQDVINAQWVDRAILKMPTLKKMKLEKKTNPSEFIEELNKKAGTKDEFKADLIVNYKEIKIDRICFSSSDDVKLYEEFIKKDEHKENQCVIETVREQYNGKFFTLDVFS